MMLPAKFKLVNVPKLVMFGCAAVDTVPAEATTPGTIMDTSINAPFTGALLNVSVVPLTVYACRSCETPSMFTDTYLMLPGFTLNVNAV